jgi:hypothetical protein
MFGSLGYWASSKGMVAVPDLSGMTEAQASTALSNVFLTYSKTTNTQTSDSNLVGKVATQSVSAGTLANYESNIVISLYEFVCVPNWVQSEISRTSTTWSGNCISDVESGTYTIFYNNVDLNGCQPSYTSQTVVNTTRSCSSCASLPNYTVREYEYSYYSEDCVWEYAYDTTYDGCGTPISKVFITKIIVCT